MISDKLTLRTITHGLGLLRYYGLNVLQHDDYSVTIDGNGKLGARETHSITRTRRRELDYPLNSVEGKTFASINSSNGWLGITASPFCSIFSSTLHQTVPTATIADLCRQATHLKKLEKFEQTACYNGAEEQSTHAASRVVFSDAGKSAEDGQLCHITGLFIAPLQANSIVQITSGSAHKARRPVKSIRAAETLAAGEALDVGKNLVNSYERLLRISIKLIFVLDSKD